MSIPWRFFLDDVYYVLCLLKATLQVLIGIYLIVGIKYLPIKVLAIKSNYREIMYLLCLYFEIPMYSFMKRVIAVEHIYAMNGIFLS